MKWQFFIRMALPMLHMAAEEFKAKDPGTTGKNEKIGIALDFAATLIESVLNDKELPKAPAVLK